MELKSEAYYYRNQNELQDIILDSDLKLSALENYKNFLPHSVMNIFKEVFIEDRKQIIV